MKFAIAVLSVFFIATELCAQVKWISIEPQKPNKEVQSKISLPKLQPVSNLFENVKIIQHLLNKTSVKKESNADDKKNWYIIKNSENR